MENKYSAHVSSPAPEDFLDEPKKQPLRLRFKPVL
jgi:hypothetical protein